MSNEEKKVDRFEGATYYTCTDAESLEYESPEEAIEAWLDSWLDSYSEPDDGGIEALIRDLCPVKVDAYERETVPKNLAKWRAERALEDFEEEWADEYGDPDGDDIEDSAKSKALEALTAAFQELIDATPVWRCEKVASREYSAEEVIAMMRKENPQWFEKES